MKEYLPLLLQTQLFSGVSEEDIAAMLGCLGARVRRYAAGEYLLRQGERVQQFALLLRGRLHVQREDYWGERSIISAIAPGELFGESFIAPNGDCAANDVVAIESVDVLQLDAMRLLTLCPTACRFHSAVLKNLFFAISEKNRRLVQKLGLMSRRSTREKLMAYLSEQASAQHSGSITIPFNRQQLADFLSVDRSAMSAELCRMRDEGLLCFKKNHFTLNHGVDKR